MVRKFKSKLFVNGEKVQKQKLSMSIKDMCDKFNLENVRKVSYSYFAKYRPKQCVFPKIEERDTCACVDHENMKILIQHLYSKKIIGETTDYQAVRSVVCEKSSLDCFSRNCKQCFDKKISLDLDKINTDEHIFKKWLTVKENRVSEKTGRPIVVTIAKKQEICKSNYKLRPYFKDEFDDFLQHIHRCLFQQRSIKKLISSLNEN